MANTIVFRSPSPDMVVEHVGTRQAGRCYTISTFKVTSTTRLKHSVFEALRESGHLGYGQGYSVSSPTEETQLLTPVETDANGKLVAEGYDTVLNPYSRQPYKETYRTVYVYKVTSECDSSD